MVSNKQKEIKCLDKLSCKYTKGDRGGGFHRGKIPKSQIILPLKSQIPKYYKTLTLNVYHDIRILLLYSRFEKFCFKIRKKISHKDFYWLTRLLCINVMDLHNCCQLSLDCWYRGTLDIYIYCLCINHDTTHCFLYP